MKRAFSSASEQQRYLEVCQKLADGTPLHGGEQLWLLDVLRLSAVHESFFPPRATGPGRGQKHDLHFWMTMDSVTSGDPEKVVAARWKQRGRIANVLRRWRPECVRLVAAVPGVKQAIKMHWHRLVSKPTRVLVQQKRRRKPRRL